MASDILGLFASPQQYERQRQADMEAQALQMARLSPKEQGQFGIAYGAQQLGRAIGGALGGVDPQLQKITQRQQLLGMIDPSNPDSYAQAIQTALQGGDQEAAFLLRNEMMKAQEQAAVAENRKFEREGRLIERKLGEQKRGMESMALSLANGIDPETGQPTKPLFDPVTRTFNQDVADQLISRFPTVGAEIVRTRLESVQGIGTLQDKQLLKTQEAQALEKAKLLFTSEGAIDQNVIKELMTNYGQAGVTVAEKLLKGVETVESLQNKQLLKTQEVQALEKAKLLFTPEGAIDQNIVKELMNNYGQAGVDVLEKRLKGVQGVESLQDKQLARSRTDKANELFGRLKKPDGSIDEDVKAQLLSSPEGRKLIEEQASILKPLRQLGAAGAPEEDPFKIFIDDPTIPETVKISARQLSSSFKKGLIDPEKVDGMVTKLSDTTQRIQQFEQTQAQIKATQDVMASLKRQGLETSQQYLALAQEQAKLNKTLKAQKIAQDVEIARNKPLPVLLQRDESKDLELVDSLRARSDSLLPAINSLTVDPKTKKAPLELGPINNLTYLAQNAAGNSTVESRAYAQLQRAVQEATNLKTDAAKGVQTDKDVLRFANELIAAFGKNDTKTSLEALNNFYKSTIKAEENTKRRIDSRRTSQGVQPYYGSTVGTAQNPIKLD